MFYASPFLCLGCSKHRAAKTSPSGGKYREAGIGVHFPERSEVGLFSPRVLARLYGFIIRGALYDLKGACHLPRSGEKNRKLTPLSSVAYGAPPSWGRGLYIAALAATTTLGPKGPIKLKNPRPGRAVNLKNLFL